MHKVAGGYGLVEAPVWSADEGLFFSDVLNGGVYRLGFDDHIDQVIPKRRGVGGMALHAGGGLIVGGRNIAWVGDDGETRVLLAPDVIPGAIGFNDLTTDAAGRIYVGSLAYRVFADPPKPGFLHVIDLDGSMRTLSDGVMLTNGLGFSPDGQRLYHSDARAGLVRVYDVKADGSVGPWRQFATLGEDRVADGLKVASDGSVWVADARGGRVAVFEPRRRASNGPDRATADGDQPLLRQQRSARSLRGHRLRRRAGARTAARSTAPASTSPGLPLAPARVAI